MADTTLYTRTGDTGQTHIGSNGGGRRVPKTNGALEVTGNIDELISYLGLARAGLPQSETALAGQLSALQKQLLLLKEDITSFGMKKITAADVEMMERQIDEYAPCASMKDPAMLPGACESSAQLDIARSVARRMERSLTKAGLPAPIHMKYVNRLSDYLYSMARYMDFREGLVQKLTREMGDSTGTAQKPVQPKAPTVALPLALAKRLLEELEREAETLGIQLVMAVSDASGRPIAVHVMDDAFIASYDIAVNKAFTAVSLKMPTKDLAPLCQPGGSLYGLQNTNDGRIVIFGGGVPLKDSNDRIIGGLGVSGSTAEIDTHMGDLGVQIFNRLLG